ncbi:DUF563 domain-containing protein [Siccirubricoccus sp. G192]|uniref:glycosyltransferase family 61 protein n=1 Tax=Siccirubricoccus sp. G192 TaxID=2849651 RepID=UPI001C2CAFEA|nr:glycosyltransferase 61 family protein [Siccirubricoccus sp. G192]MBV1796723.1 glycosyltransferase family 61 protein [Siccirubricoccus sp. G192]
MIYPHDPLTLPAETGVRVCSVEPFRAEWATDSSGIVRRPRPVAIDTPFGPSPTAEQLASNTIIETPDIFTIEVPNGILVAARAIVTDTAHYLVTDSRHSRHTPDIYRQEERRRFEALHLEPVENGYFHAPSITRHVKFEEDIVSLTAMEHNNYGAFLLRCLTKLPMIRKLGLQKLKTLAPIGNPWQRDILSAFGVDLNNVLQYNRENTYQAKHIIMPSLRTSALFLDDTSRDLFQEMAQKMLAADEFLRRPEKIYVSRRAQGVRRPSHRRFKNEGHLINEMEAIGFHIFEPENHTFAEQVKTFASAKIVVGPGGAGMFNTVFCRPGSFVLSLEPMDHWLIMHANIFASMKHAYAMIIGGADEYDPATQKQWQTDVDCVVARTKGFLRSF